MVLYWKRVKPLNQKSRLLHAIGLVPDVTQCMQMKFTSIFITALYVLADCNKLNSNLEKYDKLMKPTDIRNVYF